MAAALPLMQWTGASYGISWRENAGVLCVGETYGSHPFLEDSAPCTFLPEHGIVGKAWTTRRPSFLRDASSAVPSVFVRHEAARARGIHSIIYLPQRDGSLFELGFDVLLDEVLLSCTGRRTKLLDDGRAEGAGAPGPLRRARLSFALLGDADDVAGLHRAEEDAEPLKATMAHSGAQLCAKPAPLSALRGVLGCWASGPCLAGLLGGA